MKKRVLLFIVLILAVVATSSCMLSPRNHIRNRVSRNAAYCISEGIATFDDVAIEDRWGIVWAGLFDDWSVASGESEHIIMKALRIGLGISITRYDSYTSSYDNKTTYYYRVQNKGDLQKLAGIALDLLEEQYSQNPEIALKWHEELYHQITKTKGKYNEYTLMPYLENLNQMAKTVFEYEAAISEPETLSNNSSGARLSKIYLEKYPNGHFAEFAKARQEVR